MSNSAWPGRPGRHPRWHRAAGSLPRRPAPNAPTASPAATRPASADRVHRGHVDAEADQCRRQLAGSRADVHYPDGPAGPGRLQGPPDRGLGVVGRCSAYAAAAAPNDDPCRSLSCVSAGLSAVLALAAAAAGAEPLWSFTRVSLFGRAPGVVGGPGGLDLGQVAVRPGDQLADRVEEGTPHGGERVLDPGGMTGWMVRVTMPSRSRPRRVTVSILAVMPSMARCSSLNRMVPCPSRSIAYTDHLSPTRCRTSARPAGGRLAGRPRVAVRPQSQAAPESQAAPGGSATSADGSRTGPACPESKTSPPRYGTRVRRGRRSILSA